MTNFDKKKTSCNIFCFCLNEETDDTADCNSPIQEKLSSVHNFKKIITSTGLIYPTLPFLGQHFKRNTGKPMK